MRQDRLQKVAGTSIVQEEDALSHAPQRGGTELVRTGVALGDTVRKTGPHVVHHQIREQVRRAVYENLRVECAASRRRRVARGPTRFHGWSVAEVAADLGEELGTVLRAEARVTIGLWCVR